MLIGLYLVAWIDVIATGDPPLNSAGVPMTGDYIAFHTAGRLVVSGHAVQLYEHASIVGVQDALLGGRIPGFYDAYRNPPFFALIYAPIAKVDLLSGFGIWSLLSLACLAVSTWLLLVEVPWLRSRWRGLLVFIFAFPPVYFGLIDGENAMVSLLLYVLLYRSMVRGQDVLSGVWAGLGLFKPQLFFIFPLIFLATRRWRALTTYVCVAVAMLVVSFALVGADGLQAWIRILLEPEGGNATVNGWRMASAKSFFDSLLPGLGLISLSLYLATSLALLGVLFRVWSRPVASLPGVWALTVLIALLVDPHLVDYDLTVLVLAGVLIAPRLRQYAWLVIPLYLVTLLRAQVPVGDGSLLLTTPLLACCTLFALRQILRLPRSTEVEAGQSAPLALCGSALAGHG